MSFADVLQRLTRAVEEHQPGTSYRSTSVQKADLRELLHHFNRLDAEARQRYEERLAKLATIARHKRDGMTESEHFIIVELAFVGCGFQYVSDNDKVMRCTEAQLVDFFNLVQIGTIDLCRQLAAAATPQDAVPSIAEQEQALAIVKRFRERHPNIVIMYEQATGRKL